MKSRDGAEMKVRVTDNVTVTGVAKSSMLEIKPGSYIGVSAMPEPDGTQMALAIQIFPEAQRGVAEGFRPWDQRANSTMTSDTRSSGSTETAPLATDCHFQAPRSGVITTDTQDEAFRLACSIEGAALKEA